MEFNIFRKYIPKGIDIRPDVANISWLYIDSEFGGEESSLAIAFFLNNVIDKTRCQKDKFDRSNGSTTAKDRINGMRRSDVSKRGGVLLPQAILYWFFRFEPNPSYFLELAKIVWRKDSEPFKRFCYAKEGARREDPFKTIMDRFRSDEALTYKIVLSDAQQRLSATYAATIELGSSYQAGRDEFHSAKKLLVSKRSTSVALTASIHGAGGYGKSCLAQELCDDEDIRKRFLGGIYWLQFGLLDSNDEDAGVVGLPQAIDRMLYSQYSKCKRPLFIWDNRDSDILQLVEILPAERLLLVVDDLWTQQHWSWVKKVPANVSVLVTTRRQSVAKATTHEITIKRITDEASYKLLTHGMANIAPRQQKRFRELVKKFRGWPLLLSLGNGIFKHMSGNAEARIDRSISEYEQFFEDDQIDAWDIEETGEEAFKKRRKLVGFCIEASLKAIPSSNNPGLLRKMSVFPDDAELPFSVVVDFWKTCTAKKIGNAKGMNLLRYFNDFSFFLRLMRTRNP